MFCFKHPANKRIELVLFRSPGENGVPAAVHPTVHPAGKGVAARIETKGGATAHTGHAAGTEGNTIAHAYSSVFILHS